MVTYKSKTGPELLIPILLILGSTLVLITLREPRWPGFVIILPLIAFILYVFTQTRYHVEGNILHIRCGFLYNKQIDIESIRKIRESNDPISSPATSMDRLEILYGKNDRVLISPARKKDFIKRRQEINPEITVMYRKKHGK